MQPQLRRELTFVSATALVISNIIGTGIFTTTGYLARDLGHPVPVLGIWLVGGVAAIAGCLSYAELGINFPRSGGEYVYLREAWGPAWGFLSGWVSFFAGFSAPVAAGALAFSEYLSHFFPSLSVTATEKVVQTTVGHLHLGRGHWLAVGVIAAFSLVNILGLALAAKVQNVLTLLKLGVLVIFLVLAFSVGDGNWSNFAGGTARTSSHSLSAQFAVSLIFVMFAYSGWNAATYVAEEMKTPERTLPLAMVTGTGIAVLFYVALNVAFIYAVPLESLKGVVRVGATTASALFGHRVGGIFSGIMALAVLSCVSAMVLVGPRVSYAMARDGCFFRGAARVHPRWRTPFQATLFQAAAAALMVLTGTFEALITYIGFTLVLFAALATTGIFRMRRRATWKRLRAVNWCYPTVPVVFLTASVWMLVHTLVLRPRVSLFGLLTVACGGLVYRLRFWKTQAGTRPSQNKE